MCRKIFIGATGQHCGKTTISLSLMHLAQKKYGRVGFMKPIGPKWIVFNGMYVDKDAAMFSTVFGVEEDVALAPGSEARPQPARNPAAIAPSLTHLRCCAYICHLPVNWCDDCSPVMCRRWK